MTEPSAKSIQISDTEWELALAASPSDTNVRHNAAMRAEINEVLSRPVFHREVYESLPRGFISGEISLSVIPDPAASALRRIDSPVLYQIVYAIVLN